MGVNSPIAHHRRQPFRPRGQQPWQGLRQIREGHILGDQRLQPRTVGRLGSARHTWRCAITTTQPKLGDLDTEMVKEFFAAFAGSAGITLHIETLYGVNNHHIAESCFKGLARALRAAVAIDPRKADAVPSTKGTLGGAPGAPGA